MESFWGWWVWGMLIALLCAAAIMAFAQRRFKAKAFKYSQIPNIRSYNGEMVSELILSRNNINGIIVKSTSDNFNPRNFQINLSPNVFESTSLYAVAVAAHEAGHAIQWKQKYRFAMLRDKMVAPVNIVSRIGWIVLLIASIVSIFMMFNSTNQQYMTYVYYCSIAAIIAIGAVGVFQLITLPVEFNASKRAKKELYNLGIITTPEEEKVVGEILRAAAFTYVAAFLGTAIVLFMWLLRAFAIKNS